MYFPAISGHLIFATQKLPMKTFLLVLLVSVISVSQTACLKSSSSGGPCTPKSIASEEPPITAYSSSTGINATRDNSGLYYRIDSLGTGATPTLSSKVFVTYRAQLLNGTVVDSQTNAAVTGWQLSSLIQGWQIGLPLIKKGGGITLLIPSSLAYGCTGYRNVPPDAIMQFNIALVDVQ